MITCFIVFWQWLLNSFPFWKFLFHKLCISEIRYTYVCTCVCVFMCMFMYMIYMYILIIFSDWIIKKITSTREKKWIWPCDSSIFGTTLKEECERVSWEERKSVYALQLFWWQTKIQCSGLWVNFLESLIKSMGNRLLLTQVTTKKPNEDRWQLEKTAFLKLSALHKLQAAWQLRVSLTWGPLPRSQNYLCNLGEGLVNLVCFRIL